MSQHFLELFHKNISQRFFEGSRFAFSLPPHLKLKQLILTIFNPTSTIFQNFVF